MATFDLGRDPLPLSTQLSIGIYDPPRSIIDAYRLRHREGPDLAITAHSNAGCANPATNRPPCSPSPPTSRPPKRRCAPPWRPSLPSNRPTRDTPEGRAYLDLQNLARRRQRPTDELHQLYALEGFLTD